jgi:hypothetical protein
LAAIFESQQLLFAQAISALKADSKQQALRQRDATGA